MAYLGGCGVGRMWGGAELPESPPLPALPPLPVPVCKRSPRASRGPVRACPCRERLSGSHEGRQPSGVEPPGPLAGGGPAPNWLPL
jgi:hypothetical protein